MASTSRNISRRRSSHSVLTTEEAPHNRIDQEVRTILNYILCHSANKVPIKYNDLLTLSDDKEKVIKKLPLVTKLLDERYGIKFIQLEGTPKRYICIADAPADSIYELTASQRPQYTLLTIILTYIFLRTNQVEEDKLYGMLDMLGIHVHEEHGYFGREINKLIEDTFVKQQYLKRERSQLSAYDDVKFSYSWGQRAKLEFTYQQIAQFASKLFNQDASFFQKQLMMAEATVDPTLQQDNS